MNSPPPAPRKIRRRDRDAILQSLRAGVVPSRGQQHIQVGRADELAALLDDIERIADGGSSFRLIIGEYGSGKTFFLSLVKSLALEKGIVTASADLNPDRRLHASKGQARNLYAELIANLSTRTQPAGGALPSVVERFISTTRQVARTHSNSVEETLRERLGQLSEMVGGFDFAEIIAAYWRGHEEQDDQLKASAVRWLRGEFTTRTDARRALNVRAIIDDHNVYDHLKLLARFVRLAGYKGLLINLDEMVNLFKLPHTGARNSNYEQLLRMLNDSLQGSAVGLGLLLGGTPEFLRDPRRGLYSYQALQSRLAENSFKGEGLKDLSGPVIQLSNLSQEELFVLLMNLRRVYASGDTEAYLISDDGLHGFMKHCAQRIGQAYFRTPRNTIRAFIDLLAVLDQNPGTRWQDLLPGVEVRSDQEPVDDTGEDSEAEELATFTL